MKPVTIILLLICVVSAQAQDTTYNTYQVRHDSVVTTTIPEQIICRDSTILVLDTSYNAYFDYKLYATVDGSVYTTLELCDTIPAHDTLVTIETIHDTTVMIITAHPVTFRPNNQTKAYGTVFTFTNNGSQISVTGGSLKPGDVLTVDNAASPGSVANAAAGAYSITLSAVTIMRGATNVTSTYAINYQFGTLTVSPPIPITIKADDQGKVAGQTFTFTHDGTQVHLTSGVLNSGDAITVDNAASTGSGSGAAAGTYPITLSSVTIMNGATNVTNRYNITYQTGTLTVAAAPQIITVAARNQIKVYGNTFSFLGNGSQVQVISGGLSAGDVITADNATSSGAAASATVGSYTISLSSITIMNGATNVTGNYTITYQAGTMSVTARPLTVKANNQTKTQGQTFTFTNNGTQVSIVSGTLASGHSITADNAASTGAASGATVGSYPITLSSITISAPANVTSNYAITYQPGTLVVSSATVDISYGVFAAASDYGTNLQGRMNHAHYLGVPVFRYNYDYRQAAGGTSSPAYEDGPTYRVGQIIDDGLICALTFNHNANGMQWPAGDHTFPNTTAEINFYSSKLDSLLGLPDKPEIVSINNEEGHREYWTGTVQEYLTWMEKCVQVSHAHGIPCTNGGTTIGIVYAMLQWYIDLGKPADSIQYIKDKYGITGNATGPFATEMRQWYQALLAGFAVSDMDYVNVHWYEPARDNTTDVVTSGLIPLIINYIQSVTGKGVITTEMGVKNGDYGLAFEYFDQWKAAGCKYIIYYAGSSDQGAQSYDNSEAYRAWLLQ